MGGWILLGFGLLSVVFTTVITIVLFQVSRRMECLTMPIYLFPLLAGVLVALIFIGTGLFMVNKGMKSRRIMQTGKKAECRVHNVLRVKNGYQLVVTYRGDSGNEHMHSLYIKYQDALLLRPDMVLECYVDGEECYIDESHIAIKEN